MKRQCTLLISYACNLNCIYCYEQYKSNRYMQFDIAKKIIKNEIEFVNTHPNIDLLEFMYMGGEPLLNFNLIKELCEWTWNLYSQSNYIFSVVTNGTLLDDSMQKWFEKHHEKIVLKLSVDGCFDMHTTNRGAKAFDIPIHWVHLYWPDVEFKMTVSKKTICYFAEGILYFQRYGYKVIPVLAVGENWTNKEAFEYEKQIKLLADYYLSNTKERPHPLLLKSIDALFDTTVKQEKCCGAGERTVTYDVDGEKYPCVIFTPLVLGRDVRNDLLSIDFQNVNEFIDPKCENCVISNLCKTCYGYNYKERGTIFARDRRVCNMYKAEIRAICLFQKQYIERNKAYRLLSEKERKRLQHVLLLLEKLAKQNDIKYGME